MAKEKFQALDAIRGVAALAVAEFHFDSHWGAYLAVDLFFVLSAFVICHSYPAPVAFGRFMLHRLARLYPLHLFTLVTFIAASLLVIHKPYVFGVHADWALIENLTLTQNIGLPPQRISFNFTSWSISVEMVLSILYALVIARRPPVWLLLLVSASALGLIATQSDNLEVTASNLYGVINAGVVRGIASFSLGMVAYRAYQRLRDREAARLWCGRAEWVCAGLIMLLVLCRHGKTSPIDFVAPPIFAITVLVFAFEAGRLSRGLMKLIYLGTISYSIYLNQLTVLTLAWGLGEWLRPRWIFLIYMIGLLLVSHLTYRYIELPSRRWLRQRADAWLDRRSNFPKVVASSG